jgi:hypothetical protein
VRSIVPIAIASRTASFLACTNSALLAAASTNAFQSVQAGFSNPTLTGTAAAQASKRLHAWARRRDWHLEKAASRPSADSCFRASCLDAPADITPTQYFLVCIVSAPLLAKHVDTFLH